MFQIVQISEENISCHVMEETVTIRSNTQGWASNRRGVVTERTVVVVWINAVRGLGMIISSECVQLEAIQGKRT